MVPILSLFMKIYQAMIRHLNKRGSRKRARQIGKSIRRERLRKGMSEKELASQMEVSLYLLRRIESGETEIKYHTFFKACDALRVHEGALAPSSRYNAKTWLGDIRVFLNYVDDWLKEGWV